MTFEVIRNNFFWRVRRAETSDLWCASCDELRLDVQGETLEKLVEVMEEAAQALLEDWGQQPAGEFVYVDAIQDGVRGAIDGLLKAALVLHADPSDVPRLLAASLAGRALTDWARFRLLAQNLEPSLCRDQVASISEAAGWRVWGAFRALEIGWERQTRREEAPGEAAPLTGVDRDLEEEAQRMWEDVDRGG